jgi:hypothetical protein
LNSYSNLSSYVKVTNAGLLALCLCAAPRICSAQTMQWTDKGYVSVDGGGQIASHTLNTRSTFSIYGEDATVESKQKVKSGGLFDIGGAYRVYGHNILAGATFSHASSKSDVSLHSAIPDPVFFDRPRTVDSSQSGAKHSENALHLDAIWMMPVADKIDVGLFAGPSIFFVRQDTVGALTVTEPGPSVSASVGKSSKTTAGINLGADLQYMVYKDWAVGGVARFSWGSAKIDGATKHLSVGGLQLAAGVRYRF